MIKTYRKTATIKAEKFDEAKWQSIYNDSHNPEEWDIEAQKFGIDHYHGYFIIPTREGDMRIHDGDWIATGINGEHWPISDDVFKKTYAELPVIPKAVAGMIENYRRNEPLSNLLFDAGTFHFENRVLDWIRIHDEVVARAWLDGYQVKEDK
ncbi:hypothetical protein AZI11_08295 [Levilactobacillus brevis]|uniref:DUF1642 domain-containing protein n=1 Tax=Levilactobacillus brevis TaxID=1580 RepID=UPI000A20BA70|nr:DUF1642 domain-containing protein [Levilactobacillus brevis]ARN92900.1 hypothetical protein AZI11_08295 [Levilactobacillus brevis]ARN95544.1 hypothetical protein AZI12_08345 [Levilactobacillus brevis]